jgi:hypothetical protein
MRKNNIYSIIYITMFLNPIAYPLDEPFYLPTKQYNIYDVKMFWQEIEYNNNLIKL